MPEEKPIDLPARDVVTPEEHHTISSTFFYILVFFLPPIAIYYAYKEHKYQSWLAYLLWLYGISLIAFCVSFLPVTGQLLPVYRELGISQLLPTSLNTIIYASVAVSILAILLGIIVGKEAKQLTGVSTGLRMLSVVFLTLLILMLSYIPVYLMFNIINPIYSAMGQLDSVEQMQTPKPTPTPNPTASWKTYTETNVGLTFNYQSTLNCSEQEQQRVTFIVCEQVTPSGNTQKSQEDIAIYGYSMVSEQHFIMTERENPGVQEKTITVAGRKATMFVLSDRTDVLVQVDPTFYLVITNYNSNQNDFNQMLSTFKFIDQTSESSIPPLYPSTTWTEVPKNELQKSVLMWLDLSNPGANDPNKLSADYYLSGEAWKGKITYKVTNKNYTSNDYNDPVETYYFSEMKKRGWFTDQNTYPTVISTKSINIEATAADGVCGFTHGYLKKDGNMITQLTIQKTPSPCYGMGGPTLAPNSDITVEYEIAVSNPTPIDTILSGFK